ncbi:MAG: TldD/PmbA family protein [Firmicutes bacterium]|nr:TldD/PmbA family protein [Bacillota bacterium]
MVEQTVIQEVLRQAMSRGGDFADIFIEYKRVTGIGCEDGKIEHIHSGIENGAGIRVLSNDNTAYGYTNDLSRDGLLEAARIVSHAVSGTKGEMKTPGRQLEPTATFDIKRMPDKVTAAEKVSAVKAAEAAARAVDRDKIKQVIVGYGDVVQKVIIADSNGGYVEDERVRTRLVVQAIAVEGAVLQTGYEAVGSHSGFELLESKHPEAIGTVAAKRAVQMLAAKPAPAGKMAVVLAGEAGGTMVHEACGHSLEADLVQKGLSVYAGKMGQKVAAECVTVVDDASMPDQYGSYRFDDEGVPSRKVTLIEKGVLKDFLYDRITARRDGVEPNGHGRRESYQHKPIPRMGNTYIAAGTEDPQKIIRETGNGLLVTKMGGGQVNTTTGDFVFDVAEGFLITAGQVGPMVRGATLTGNGPAVLNIVEAVGNDLGFTIGTCGKDGQGVPVGDAQPTLRIKELVVGGTGHD